MHKQSNQYYDKEQITKANEIDCYDEMDMNTVCIYQILTETETPARHLWLKFGFCVSRERNLADIQFQNVTDFLISPKNSHERFRLFSTIKGIKATVR